MHAVGPPTHSRQIRLYLLKVPGDLGTMGKINGTTHGIGGRAMKVTCRVCGRTTEVAIWSEEYERLKAAEDPAYVCDACAQKIRVEAQNEQSH